MIIIYYYNLFQLLISEADYWNPTPEAGSAVVPWYRYWLTVENGDVYAAVTSRVVRCIS